MNKAGYTLLSIDQVKSYNENYDVIHLLIILSGMSDGVELTPMIGA